VFLAAGVVVIVENIIAHSSVHEYQKTRRYRNIFTASKTLYPTAELPDILDRKHYQRASHQLDKLMSNVWTVDIESHQRNR
jgi:hypothetical protein